LYSHDPVTEATTSGPLHGRIAADLRAKITSGELRAGEQLPSEARLCEEYGVSRGTVRHALGTLHTEGLIAGGRGRRPVVRDARLAQSFDELVSFTAWAREIGQEPGARTLELARRPAREPVARALDIDPLSPVYELLRVRTLDGRPVMVERTTFVEDAGRFLIDADLDNHSVYERLAQSGVRLREAEHTIEAIPAGVEDADLLEVPRRSPLLQVTRLARDSSQLPVEWSVDRFRADCFAITVHNTDADRRAGVRMSTG
jgi:GntR family transcriptional regulator